MSDEVKTKTTHKHKKRIISLSILTAIVVLVISVVFLLWLFIWKYEVSTTDAYVKGNLVEITPQIGGNITSINVQETDFVEEGQVILSLDPTDYAIALDESLANLADVVRSVQEQFENYRSLLFQLMMSQADLIKAQFDFQNRYYLIDSGAISLENFQESETRFFVSQASLTSKKYQLLAAQSLIYNTTVDTHPKVIKAKNEVKRAYLNLKRCDIKAPITGFVANRTVQVGEYISPRSRLLVLIPLNEIWVDGNYKESQLKKIRIGQKVKMTSDIYGKDIVYDGKVLGIGAGSGEIFSLIPPQNATGNWVKVTQRVPVRISIDKEDLIKYPLRVGLSMATTIHLDNEKGLVLKVAKTLPPIYTTDIYESQIEGVDQIIEEVIQENILPPEEIVLIESINE